MARVKAIVLEDYMLKIVAIMTLFLSRHLLEACAFFNDMLNMRN